MNAVNPVITRPASPPRHPTRALCPAHRLDRPVGEAFSLAFIVALMLALPTLCVPWSGAGWLASASSATPLSAIPVALVSNGNVSYCGLLGEDPAAIADLPNFTANVSALWSNLCGTPAFVSVINEWGNLRFVSSGSGNNTSAGNNISYWTATNLSIQTGGVIGQVPSVFFVIAWVSLCDNSTLGPAPSKCSFEEYWAGNLSSNQLRGPFSSERPEISTVPGVSSPVSSPLLSREFIVAVGLAIAIVVGISIALLRRRPPEQSGAEARVNDEEPPLTRPTSGAHSKSDGPDPLEDVI
jgi:hypothetical protein